MREVEWDWNESYKLHDYQEVIVAECRAKQRGLVVLATGGGKTIVAGAIIKEIGVAPVVFFVTSKELLEQSKDKLEKALKLKGKIGVIGDGKCDIHDISVCTIQTCVSAFGRESEYKQSVKDIEDLEDVTADQKSHTNC